MVQRPAFRRWVTAAAASLLACTGFATSAPASARTVWQEYRSLAIQALDNACNDVPLSNVVTQDSTLVVALACDQNDGGVSIDQWYWGQGYATLVVNAQLEPAWTSLSSTQQLEAAASVVASMEQLLESAFAGYATTLENNGLDTSYLGSITREWFLVLKYPQGNVALRLGAYNLGASGGATWASDGWTGRLIGQFTTDYPPPYWHTACSTGAFFAPTCDSASGARNLSWDTLRVLQAAG